MTTAPATSTTTSSASGSAAAWPRPSDRWAAVDARGGRLRERDLHLGGGAGGAAPARQGPRPGPAQAAPAANRAGVRFQRRPWRPAGPASRAGAGAGAGRAGAWGSDIAVLRGRGGARAAGRPRSGDRGHRSADNRVRTALAQREGRLRRYPARRSGEGTLRPSNRRARGRASWSRWIHRRAAIANAQAWFEVNSGWAPPDPDTLAEWVDDGVCRCPDECLVAPEAPGASTASPRGG